MIEKPAKQKDRPSVRYFDYKDVETLKKYLNPHGRIVGRKHTRLQAGAQRALAQAVKRARFLALIPYVAK